MKFLKRLWQYREFDGDWIAWKVGDFTCEDDPRGSQFSACLDFNIDCGQFNSYARDPKFRTVASYLSHSLHAQVWRWGFFISVRGKEA